MRSLPATHGKWTGGCSRSGGTFVEVSVVVLTHNSEMTLRRCLDSVLRAPLEVVDVVVVDDESSDATVSIASGFCAEVIRSTLTSFAEQRNVGIGRCTSEWILHLDDDEELSEELSQRIAAAQASPECDAYAIMCRNVIFGRPLDYARAGRDWHVRLHRNGLQFSGAVHERLEVDQRRVRRLHGPIVHHTTASVGQWLSKASVYAPRDSYVGLGVAFFAAFRVFVGGYVLPRGWRDGRRALVWYVLSAVYPLICWAFRAEQEWHDEA